MYSLGMVMTEFSLPDRSTPWEGELANSALIYDYIRRRERPAVTEENLTGLSDDNDRQWMRLLRACWDQDPSRRPSATDAHHAMMSICGPEPGNNYKTFEQLSDENPDTLFVPLSNHQGMAGSSWMRSLALLLLRTNRYQKILKMTLQVTFKQAMEAIPASIFALKSPPNSSNVKKFLLIK